MLALYQALRVHEIAKIRGDDFTDGWLYVEGKGGSRKRIPVHPEIARLAETMPPRGCWFPSPNRPGQPVTARAVTFAIKRALLSVGTDATAHQLRDTAATWVQRHQGDIRVTQAFLRHSSIQNTMKYTQVSDTDLTGAVGAISW